MLNIIAAVMLFIGLFFFLGGAVGVLRFPDFYSRLHPAGKMDTLASLMMLGGLAVYELNHIDVHTIITALKIMLIVVFVFLASPTATHAIVDAGFRAGMKPWTKGQPRR